MTSLRKPTKSDSKLIKQFLRWAITGKLSSPSFKELVDMLGYEEIGKRIFIALKELDEHVKTPRNNINMSHEQGL